MTTSVSESSLRPAYLPFIIKLEEEEEEGVKRIEELKSEQKKLQEYLKKEKEKEREKTAST